MSSPSAAPAAGKPAPKPLPFIYQFTAGAIAGVSEILCFYPLDVVKAPKRAVKFASNDFWGKTFMDLAGSDKMTQGLSIATGMSAGATESFVVVPFELVKIKLQDKASTFAGPLDVVKRIVRADGILGLYAGLEATFWRHVWWNGGYFGSIFTVKAQLPKAEVCSLSFTLGVQFRHSDFRFLGTVVNTPFDVVKSRIQGATKVPGVVPKYNWTYPSLVLIAREEGLAALYKGFLPKVLRLAPGGGVLLLVVEATLGTMAKQQPKWIRALKVLAFSRRGLTIFKGALAYTLAFVLIFLHDFDRLSKYPQTLVCLLVGSFNFFVLAKLSPWIIAQAVYFFVAVYVIAYVKTQGLRYFGPTIFAILMSFNGIYTSLLLGGKFEPRYLIEYLKSYLWGSAINIFVSVCIFPWTSERELRRTLIASLQHIETFGMLISRSYLMIITEEEKAIRDNLAQTIRADFGFLQQKLEETTLEINWSKWSLDDYRYFIGKTRALQLALISTHSSLANLEQTDDILYRTAFIPKTLGPFNRVRLDMRLTIREIEIAFGFSGEALPKCAWESYLDIERRVAESDGPSRQSRRRGNSFLDTADEEQRRADLQAVAQRLAAEFEHAPHDDESSPIQEKKDHRSSDKEGSTPSRHSGESQNTSPPPATTFANTPRVAEEQLNEEETKEIKRTFHERGPATLASDFQIFKDIQHELITKTLIGGTLTNCDVGIKLKVESPQPSIHDVYGLDYVRGNDKPPPISASPSAAPSIRKRTVKLQAPDDDDSSVGPRARDTTSGDVDSDDEAAPERPEDRVAIAGDHSLVRIYSLLFALSQYCHELCEFHSRVTAKDAKGRPRRHRLHFHFFESLRRHPHAPTVPATSDPESDEYADLSLAQAIAILESRPWQPKKLTIWHRVHALKMWFLGSNSLYALKSAAATTVFAIFIYANKTRQWFISYSLTGGLITVVVALAPTIGQSALTFMLQIVGSSIGYLFGLLFLTIFHNVGGYVYNPYGLTCLIFLYSLPFQYVIYEQPKFFALALLALNGTGVLVCTEYIYKDYFHRPFDSPAYRTGKALASLAVAVALTGIFQLFIARNPARRALRLSLAHVTRSNLAYLTLLQAFVRAMIPADPKHKAPEPVFARVVKELKRREMKIQAEIIAIMPLLTFAAAEPSLSNKFNAKPYLRLIKANQAILDRLRESRDAIGSTRFTDSFLAEFVAPLSPYRRRSTRLTKTALSLGAASLASKQPLPSDVPRIEWANMLPDFLHDALVLSHRFAQTPEGQDAVRKGEFTRYWFFVLAITSIYPQLIEIQDVCHIMFGKLEDSLM
ncbi:hypothetical protein FRB99_003016 [Tulasnella sp. 403]|nr:hypothetical protein FRB99_003016 [Tulasnella sp. 403]